MLCHYQSYFFKIGRATRIYNFGYLFKKNRPEQSWGNYSQPFGITLFRHLTFCLLRCSVLCERDTNNVHKSPRKGPSALKLAIGSAWRYIRLQSLPSFRKAVVARRSKKETSSLPATFAFHFSISNTIASSG